MIGRRWRADEFCVDASLLAPRLLGQYVIHETPQGICSGRIVETEAYGGFYDGFPDDGAHSFRGLTKRTAPMFHAGGISYVYLIYGMYCCFNVVAGPEGEGQAAQALIDDGCDVIAQHCDTNNPQIAARDAGVWGVGYNSDMTAEVGESVLTSVVWNWGAYYTAAVQSVIDGTWDGSNYYGGMNENLVGITSLADFCTDGTQEAVDTAKEDILSGKNGVFDGVIETNTGETVGEEGKTLDDATITGGINWYFKTVEVVE